MTQRPRTSVSAVAVATLVVLLSPAPVGAHAELLSTTPVDGATVVGTPPLIAATFSEELLPDSTLSIRDAAGNQLGVGGPDPSDETRLVIDPVPELAPATYELRWRAVTADGHRELGTWTFTVTAPQPTGPPPTTGPTDAPSPSASPSDAPSPSASDTPSASPGPGDPTGTDGTSVLLPIIAALLIVAIGGALLLGRRGRPGAGT